MARTTINSLGVPAGTITAADLTFPLTDFSSTGIDDNATSNALTIDSSQDVTFSSHALFPDNSRARFGAGLDLQIYHDGSNSYIDESSGVGNLIVKGANVLLQNTTGENYLTLTTNGAATLYYDNAATLATTSYGVDITGRLVTTSHIDAPDDARIRLGDDDDLQIYHDGSNSVIKDAGTGNLLIQGATDLVLEDTSGANYFRGVSGSYVRLYHSNSTRLETTSTGIDVTGTALADTLETSTGSGGLLNIIRDDPTIGIDNSLGAIYWKSTEDSGTTVNIGAGILALADQNHSTTASGSRLTLQTTAVSATSPSERLRISAGGDISFYEDTGTTQTFFWDASAESLGIGTTSPAYPLDVVGPIRINHVGSDLFATIRGPGNRDLRIDIDANGDTDSFVVRDLRDGSERFKVQAGGNVGIGTTSPVRQLSIEKNGTALASLVNTAGGSCQLLFGDSVSDTQGRVLYDNNGD